YGGAEELRPTLEYDFQTEKEFDYSGLTMSEIISHLARFVSNLWQIHIFGEGNTRTTAVFFIKYLKFLGFNVTNDVFAKNAWYFRNSLVRANYTNIQKGVHEDRSFLEIFLKNLLMGENNELKNRFMHIAWKETTHSDGKQHIERHFQKKTDLLSILDEQKVTTKTKTNIVKLYESFGIEKIFGRRDVVEILGITEKPATTLLGKMYSLNLTEKITGAGKGKYRFIV
ncbi:MAG: Fic family protein, partial [Lachnospiraceae bacterium]|nr:Fic family protein [Lachnospiraceae bacterium]